MPSPRSIQFLTETIQQLKIAVIGDVMLDRYVYGEVKRISPEAPVPVNHVRRMESVLGGAGNVAANLAGLGAKVYVAGVTGLDEHRESLEKSWPRREWITADYSLCLSGGPLPKCG